MPRLIGGMTKARRRPVGVGGEQIREGREKYVPSLPPSPHPLPKGGSGYGRQREKKTESISEMAPNWALMVNLITGLISAGLMRSL